MLAEHILPLLRQLIFIEAHDQSRRAGIAPGVIHSQVRLLVRAFRLSHFQVGTLGGISTLLNGQGICSPAWPGFDKCPTVLTLAQSLPQVDMLLVRLASLRKLSGQTAFINSSFLNR